jgi:hypothetical protein
MKLAKNINWQAFEIFSLLRIMKLATNVSWQASKWIINIFKLSCDSCLNNTCLMERSIWRFEVWINGIHKFGMLFMHLETRANCPLLGCECTFKFYKQAYEKRETYVMFNWLQFDKYWTTKKKIFFWLPISCVFILFGYHTCEYCTLSNIYNDKLKLGKYCLFSFHQPINDPNFAKHMFYSVYFIPSSQQFNSQHIPINEYWLLWSLNVWIL